MQVGDSTAGWAWLGSVQLHAGLATAAVVGLELAGGGPTWSILGCLVVAVVWARAGGLLTRRAIVPVSVPAPAAEPAHGPIPPIEAAMPPPEATDTTEGLRGAAVRGLTAVDGMLDDVDLDLGRSQALLSESVEDLNDRFENLKDCAGQQLRLVEMLV